MTRAISTTWDGHEAALTNLSTLVHACPSSNTLLYGLLDAAIDSSLYARLIQEPKSSHVTCLFDGKPALEYGSVAPYLMELNPDSPLTRDWLGWGWQRNWGIWLASHQSLARVKTHLKKFLFVKNIDGKAYFRYYDPRVLPQVMRIFTDAQLAEFFGLDGRVRIESWFTLSGAQSVGKPQETRLIGYRPSVKFIDRFTGVSGLDEKTWPWQMAQPPAENSPEP
jgi:hypothetical protein